MHGSDAAPLSASLGFSPGESSSPRWQKKKDASTRQRVGCVFVLGGRRRGGVAAPVLALGEVMGTHQPGATEGVQVKLVDKTS